MRYNFDEVINRLGTASVKWDGVKTRFGVSDALPMWVADMDFRSPEPVIEALMNRAKHGVFGYTFRTDSYHEAIVNWLLRRHGWGIEKDWISHAPGVVPALGFLIEAFTEAGDGVIIQPPVYYPFKRVIEAHQRVVVTNPLRLVSGHYEMDFEDLKQKVQGAKMLILSNPHNPVGRVWTKDELTQLGNICLDAGVLVVSDEIHSDLIYRGYQHIPFASLGERFAQYSVTCLAPSKTFNLAGLQTAYAVLPNSELKERYEKVLAIHSMNSTNVFGAVALEAAYNYGESWLEELLTYLAGNLEFLTQFLQARLPEVKVFQPEGTYLVWLDFCALGVEAKALDDLFVREAKVALDEGHLFGEEGNGLERINIACPRSVLATGLEQIAAAVEAFKGASSSS